MSPKIRPRTPRGMRDILPRQMIQRQYVMNVIVETFEKFGFEPLQTPAVELEETLMGKYGPDAEKLIYSVGHRGGKEKLNLRYDLSVPLCRVVAQHHELVRPFKRYQIAPVWRAERPQKGRYREFYQCDADVVGTASMLADAEILCMIYEILTRLGFEKFVIKLNDRKLINAIGHFAGVPDELLGGLYRSIDKLDKIGTEGVRAELLKTGLEDALAILRGAGISGDTLNDYVDSLRRADLNAVKAGMHDLGIPHDKIADTLSRLEALDLRNRQLIPDDVTDHLLELIHISGTNREVLDRLRDMLRDYPEAQKGIGELDEIIGYLDALGVPERYYQITPSMVRGLEYYTGPIYETVVQEPKIGSITGGGRYDELVGMFMDHSYPATGTTIGIERIIDVMDELGMFPPEVGTTVTQVLVTRFSPDLVGESLRLAGELRNAGLNTEIYFEDDRLADQIRYALKKGIPFVAVLGPDEFADGVVAIKNLPEKHQETISRPDVADYILAWFEKSR